MKLYIDYAAAIYNIYLHYISKEDIHCLLYTSYSALIESEYGTWLGMDGLPLRYAQWKYIPIGNYDRW